MACTLSAVACAPVARLGSLKQQAPASRPRVAAQFALPARAAKAPRRSAVQPKAVAGLVEVAQLAGVQEEAGFIWGVAGVMCAMTLIGLAFGFVLLRVESLAEEGKI